jgi:hypothetical protein
MVWPLGPDAPSGMVQAIHYAARLAMSDGPGGVRVAHFDQVFLDFPTGYLDQRFTYHLHDQQPELTSGCYGGNTCTVATPFGLRDNGTVEAKRSNNRPTEPND